MQYLRIQNPGIAPVESFTVFGLCMKKYSDNPRIIGMFGSGNKHSIAVCLRNRINPIVFSGNLRMDFSTRSQQVNNGLRTATSERVVVKYGGKDENGCNRSSTDDLGFDVNYGTHDWTEIGFALREFVSNSLDRAEEEADHKFYTKWAMENGYEFYVQSGNFDVIQDACPAEEVAKFRASSKPWNKVEVDIVNENQVRAKTGTTRVFIPVNDDVREFYCNLGKWFLHFSEPEMIGQTTMPKSRRNLESGSSNVVVYRRGVRVREFNYSNSPSLFDYNLNELLLDESRNAGDWEIQHQCALAIATATDTVAREMIQSFVSGKSYWEHRFSSYGLENHEMTEGHKEVWRKAVAEVAPNALIATADTKDLAIRKGYTPIVVPEGYADAFRYYKVPTVESVLNADERDGREIMEATSEAKLAFEYIWDLVTRFRMTNGRSKPNLKTFKKIMDAGSQVFGFYRDGTVYINRDIAGDSSLVFDARDLNKKLLVVMLEECVHHITKATDNSRDFQDYVLNLSIAIATGETCLKI